jgi:hypothetical protein
VGDLLIRLSVNEEMQIEGLQDQFSDAIRRVVLARKHELIHYANQRAAGSNLNAFDWQIRVWKFVFLCFFFFLLMVCFRMCWEVVK